MDDQDTVEIARFTHRYEAEMAQGYLHDAGIECLVMTDDAGGADLGLTLTRPARVLVLASDEAEARQVLEDAGVLDSGGNSEGDVEDAE